MTNTEEGARTTEEIQKLAKQCKTKNNEIYGCVQQPIFDSIPVDHIIPDTSHLFLRVSDVFINLLIRDSCRQDSLQKKSNSNLDNS